MSDIIYFYVKGQGWLGGYEQHLPKPKDPDLWRYITLDMDNAFDWAQLYGRLDRPRNIPREPRTVPHVTVTTTTGTTAGPRETTTEYYRYTYGNDNRYFMVHDEVVQQPAPRPRPTGQPRPVENQTRFVGTNVTVEAPEETIHERRLREYRDARRRFGR